MLEKLDPRKEMVTLGLCTRFQDLILDQDNNNPSGYINTKDLHIWIIDKLGKEYRMLVIYLRYLKNYAATGVQAKRRIMDETLPEESFRFPSTEKELPENNFFEEAYESRKAVKASIEAADHLRHTTSVRVKRNEIKPYNYIPSDLENSIEKALLKGDPNHVQGNDFAEEGKRTNGDEYIHIPGLRPFPYIKKVRTHHSKQKCLYQYINVSDIKRIKFKTFCKTFWKTLQRSRRDNGLGRKIVKTRQSS